MRRSRSLAPLGILLAALGCKGHLITEGPGINPPPGTTTPAVAFRIGGLGADQAVGVATDADGNVYVAGTFTGSVDFDPGTAVTALTSLGLSDGFLAKYTAAGALVWADRIGGLGADSITSLSRDAGGNLTLGGSFEGSSDFDPGPGNQVLISLGGSDGFVARYFSDGTLAWARRFGGIQADVVSEVAADAAGNVFAVGTFAGQADALPATGGQIVSTGNTPDGFLLALSAGGAITYALPIGGVDVDAATAVTVTSDGSIAVGGTFKGTADFDPGPATTALVSAGGSDAFVASYTAAGALRWARALTGVADESIETGGLAATAGGGVAVAGTFAGTTDFDPGAATVTRTSLGGTDWFVLRLDGAGAFQSVFSVGGSGADDAPRIAVDASGNLLATGGFSGSVDFDPGAANRVLTSLATAGTDIFAASYTPTGGVRWVTSFGEASGSPDRQNAGAAVAASPSGSVLVAGRLFGSPNFRTAASPFVLTSLGDADAFVITLTASGALATVP